MIFQGLNFLSNESPAVKDSVDFPDTETKRTPAKDFSFLKSLLFSIYVSIAVQKFVYSVTAVTVELVVTGIDAITFVTAAS